MIGTIDVRDLVGRPGLSRSERVSGTIDDLATELAGLSEDTPVTADLTLESLDEGILASGRLGGSMSLRCARCLKDFEQGFTVQLRELFVPFPHEDADAYPLDPEGFLDPDQMIRDAVGVELPFAPVCRPDCRGLCGRCGGDLNLGECTCTEPEIDPRWSGLEALFEELDRAVSEREPARGSGDQHERHPNGQQNEQQPNGKQRG
jgi:uncharacterized protein